jgi:hypothetical protein
MEGQEQSPNTELIEDEHFSLLAQESALGVGAEIQETVHLIKEIFPGLCGTSFLIQNHDLQKIKLWPGASGSHLQAYLLGRLRLGGLWFESSLGK